MLKITVESQETHEVSTIDEIEACVILTRHKNGKGMRAEGNLELLHIANDWRELGDSLKKQILQKLENSLEDFVKNKEK